MMSIISQINDRLWFRRHRREVRQAAYDERALTSARRAAAPRAIIDLAEQTPPMPPGTLVKVKHHRDDYVWVVAEQVPSVSEVIDLRIVRQNFPHQVSYIAGILSLEVVGRVEFTIGQRISTGIDDGEVIRITDNEVLVHYDRITRPLRGGGRVAHENCRRWYPIHVLALETDQRLQDDADNKDDEL